MRAAIQAGARVASALTSSPRAGPGSSCTSVNTAPNSEPAPYPGSATVAALEWRTEDGTAVTIRPIGPADAQLLQEFVRALSPESRYLRFMGPLRELGPNMLARFTRIDFDRDMALVAISHQAGSDALVGVSRYAANGSSGSCEFAVVVADEWQRRGLGRQLLTRLIDVARAHRLITMSSDILAVNAPMLALAHVLGFELDAAQHDRVVTRATLRLQAAPAPA